MPTTAAPDVLEGLEHFRRLVALQQPTWPDAAALADATTHLASSSPLVVPAEADLLRDRLAAAGRGEAFLLQGGDCAETFAEANADRIRNKVRTILQMAVILTHGASTPVVKMGRMAGQYAKPRSSDTETRDGVTLPAYRGDMVNGHEFTPAHRVPDPQRLVQAYDISAATLNVVRAFTRGGYADLRRVHEWNQGFMQNPAYARYERTATEIDRAIRFMDACGADFDALRTVEFFVSHEALVLEYERALTRVDSRTGAAYDTSGHFVWIGERTRQIDGAHVDFLSRVANPIGVKLGPTTAPADAVALVEKLNPDAVPGRLTFITRMGAGRIREALPPLVEAVTATGVPVTWITDAMHGNTITSTSGYKTRRFEDVLDEVRGFFEVHRALGTVPGGLHCELTGDDVTEVLGGSEEIDDAGLALRYETLVDPRLNHQQSLEMAFQVAEMLRRS
ncbi:3-deoxy-D-arabinoheptulosonate-7-phosphate synthase [Sediminihabitans luteus]|uniref:Phospho-2-dehydro-3-deoxyheptonate aldolase n=1 Tax=Sediminihabitans luteus TaxID=1138585 RepID=A0A2M9CQE1_9CELL|nr:3-deoxy-7-phosphoheptulonate synthase class II [Sediminihabitans luteus]PJJ74058.1 3-deoxy-D-arabinoheptulosonate-7-phosphate synthase [Sediminihabitans luteus]GII98027.1 phospho-2-dehydro-3-deoxyheptonate aldolase [Sediminihabitans luteus]